MKSIHMSYAKGSYDWKMEDERLDMNVGDSQVSHCVTKYVA